ncbi:MAG TPA: hypothetical protein VEX38_00745 [Fimbriimonadaceae bacterium]|nr:hypothetical protein [Fimbriimonadaceae bacterium]
MPRSQLLYVGIPVLAVALVATVGFAYSPGQVPAYLEDLKPIESGASDSTYLVPVGSAAESALEKDWGSGRWPEVGCADYAREDRPGLLCRNYMGNRFITIEWSYPDDKTARVEVRRRSLIAGLISDDPP